MTTTFSASDQPLDRKKNLHCPAPPAIAGDSSELWTEVHDEVQRQLASLEAEVCRKVPGVQVAPGRTCGKSFFLFSHRTFSLPDSRPDAVVVGVTFTPARNEVTVDADVSGESTGDCIVGLPAQTVPLSRDLLLAAACEMAQHLNNSAEAIAAALADMSRGVE